MWIYPLSHSATKTIRAPCYHKFYFDFQSPLLAYSLLASPARLLLMLPISIAAANTANTLFTHICHCFTVTCFNGGFVSTFGCRWGHVRVAFSAAGAGGCGEVDPRAAGDSGPAKGAESNAGNIPGWRSQVRGMQRTANTPTTSNLCVTLHRPCAPTCTDTLRSWRTGESVAAVVIHGGLMAPSCGRRRHWRGTSGAWSRWYAAHRPRRWSSC